MPLKEIPGFDVTAMLANVWRISPNEIAPLMIGPGWTAPFLSRPSSRASARARGAYRRLSCSDADELYLHFTSLTPAERRVRFHDDLPDEAIARYVQGIDWEHRAVLAFAPAGWIELAVEVIPSREGWALCELAPSLPLEALSHQARAEIIQIALLHAHERGCLNLSIPPSCLDVLLLSADARVIAGTKSNISRNVTIDLSDWCLGDV